MATTNKKQESIFIGVNDERIELTGSELEAFLANRNEMTQNAKLLEAESKANRDKRESALIKLAELAGLTKDELASIL